MTQPIGFATIAIGAALDELGRIKGIHRIRESEDDYRKRILSGQPQPSRIPDNVVERMVKLVRDIIDTKEMTAPLWFVPIYDDARTIAEHLPAEPVDPDLIEARKWCIDRANDIGLDEAAERVMRGEGDDNPTVRDYLAGIKRGRELAVNEKGSA